jgi:hypothetical protein
MREDGPAAGRGIGWRARPGVRVEAERFGPLHDVEVEDPGVVQDDDAAGLAGDVRKPAQGRAGGLDEPGAPDCLRAHLPDAEAERVALGRRVLLHVAMVLEHPDEAEDDRLRLAEAVGGLRKGQPAVSGSSV